MTAARKRRAATPVDARTRKMRAVLAACRRLGIDDDARKELQLEVIGIGSMADMDERQIGRLLDHLNRDWKGSATDRAHIGKVKALWWSLYWLGAIDEPGDRGLSGFVKRQTGIASLRFLDHRHAHSVIEALKAWLEREGVIWPEPPLDGSLEQRQAVLDAILEKLGGDPALLDAASLVLGIRGDRPAWSERQIDELIRALGKRWRAVKP